MRSNTNPAQAGTGLYSVRRAEQLRIPPDKAASQSGAVGILDIVPCYLRMRNGVF
ncbi:unnamed protein product [Penicillium roqueforti FM164]|uniref:Genomic scaffold, ProqFM164S03 n=1 Tax=Penicillium roqueforti (strain FM164) TaxID=1365484 RepID=W6QLE2_PENRF|nr:unnamed protein product [Penicillium roqueforti FM164]